MYTMCCTTKLPVWLWILSEVIHCDEATHLYGSRSFLSECEHCLRYNLLCDEVILCRIGLMEMFHHNASCLTSSVWSSLCIMEWDKHILYIHMIILYCVCSLQAIFCTLSPLPFPFLLCPSHTYFASAPTYSHQIDALQSSFSLLQLDLLHIILSPSSLSFLSYRYNIMTMTQCWQQNLLPAGRQLSWSPIMSTSSVTVYALMTICQMLKMWWLSGACNFLWGIWAIHVAKRKLLVGCFDREGLHQLWNCSETSEKVCCHTMRFYHIIHCKMVHVTWMNSAQFTFNSINVHMTRLRYNHLRESYTQTQRVR